LLIILILPLVVYSQRAEGLLEKGNLVYTKTILLKEKSTFFFNSRSSLVKFGGQEDFFKKERKKKTLIGLGMITGGLLLQGIAYSVPLGSPTNNSVCFYSGLTITGIGIIVLSIPTSAFMKRGNHNK
jgi:hypothetical protein